METLEQLERSAVCAFEEAASLEAWRAREVEFLGRKSALSQFLKTIAALSSEERREAGGRANAVKRIVLEAAERARVRLEAAGFDAESEWIDVTDPGTMLPVGHLHILTKVEREICEIFRSLGFEIADGPEVETEFYNFDALNVPADHPARDMQDTFWLRQKTVNREQTTHNKQQTTVGNSHGLEDVFPIAESRLPKAGAVKSQRLLLRTHTSPVQVRYMETHTPPFRIIVPGRIFRSEATDASHEHTFYQFESLFVDEHVSVGHFKYVAELFFSRFFGKKVGIRLRPSFFPFVEPGFEFDIACTMCDGAGCSSCHGTGWLEIGGAGMVHQRVFEAAGYERDRWKGFAWGFGTNRLAMMKYKIPDIRLFQSGDMRFLNQF